MSRMRSPGITSLCIFLLFLALSLVAPRPASAEFHFMRINEVMVGAGDDCRIQFVELQMEAAGQNLVGGHELFFFSASNELVGTFPLPDNVSNGQNGAFILVGTSEFAAATGVELDFELPEPYLMPHGGRVSFEGPNLQAAIDSVAYGIYSGPNEGFGLAAPAFPVSGVQSLQRVRTDLPKENSTDFELGEPTPTNNSDASGSVTPPEPFCFFEDDFEDLSSWDEPTPNAGLDLNSCGLPLVADIGTLAVEDNKLLLKPGLTDQLDLGLPICFAGMTSAASLALIDEQRYRVQFDMFAQPGVITVAVFTRQHYLFDEDAKTIDISLGDPTKGAGFGFNFSFDSVTETSDHAHLDVRLGCLQEGGAEGSDDPLFGEAVEDGLLMSGTHYTVTLDSEGDDVDGPLSLRVKLFLRDAPEPADPLGSWTMPFGLNAPEGEEFDHTVLIAALGPSPDAALEISNFSICEIPRTQSFVRNLNCLRDVAGDSVEIQWENPEEADDSLPIAIVVNDIEVGRVDGAETSFVLDDAPQEDLTIQVINSSCMPATCSVCFNEPPVPAIVGETNVVLAEDADEVTVTLDSSTSVDAEEPQDALLRFWEVIAKPDRSIALIDNPIATAIQLTVDTVGEYEVELSLTDNGCSGDFTDIATETVVHTLTVAPPVVEPVFRRGDTDGNGSLEVTDPINSLSFQFLGTFTPPCKDAADFDDNGKIEVTDPIANLSHQFLGSDPPSAPGKEACGADPTPDDANGNGTPGDPGDDLGCESYPPESC